MRGLRGLQGRSPSFATMRPPACGGHTPALDRGSRGCCPPSPRRAGYTCLWRSALQLVEVGPAFRRRYFMHWVHKNHAEAALDFQVRCWNAKGCPSFAQAGTVFSVLPEGLSAPCRFALDILAMYTFHIGSCRSSITNSSTLRIKFLQDLIHEGFGT